MNDPRNHPAAREAVAALDQYLLAWNAADNAALRQAVHYPLLTIAEGGAMTVADTPEDFTTDFDALRANHNWQRSTFDHFEVLAASEGQVHLLAGYTRYTTADEPYETGRVLYIVTRGQPGWGLQLRATVREPQITETSTVECRHTIAQFFRAWNDTDNTGIQRTVHCPHAILHSDGQAVLTYQPGHLQTDFARLRDKENWRHSEYTGLEFSYADGTLALAYLTFTRHNTVGEVYAAVPALWLMTRRNKHWGIQVRALLHRMNSEYDA